MNNYKDTLRTAIYKYGAEHQKNLAIEECSELINALSKEKRGRVEDPDVITEIADVKIMCDQLSVIYGEGLVEAEVERKIERLCARMQNG